MPAAPASRPVRVRVPAKVNLHLSVGPIRADGFHDLITVYQAVGLLDEVSATPADTLSLTVDGEGAADVPTGSGNLAWQAAQLLADTAGMPPRAALHIYKNIPVAGGMAGGSADAAGALVACARLWDLDVGPTELTALATRLGSDVAFPLIGGTALGTGRGEVLEPVATAGTLHWVFAYADFGISSGTTYTALDVRRAMGTGAPPIGRPDALLRALEDGDPHAVAAHLGNDLEPVALALAPQLRDTLDAGLRLGALAALVSGSGPTCAFLCADLQSATLIAVQLGDAGVCRATSVAPGSWPGARVLT